MSPRNTSPATAARPRVCHCTPLWKWPSLSVVTGLKVEQGSECCAESVLISAQPHQPVTTRHPFLSPKGQSIKQMFVLRSSGGRSIASDSSVPCQQLPNGFSHSWSCPSLEVAKHDRIITTDKECQVRCVCSAAPPCLPKAPDLTTQ